MTNSRGKFALRTSFVGICALIAMCLTAPMAAAGPAACGKGASANNAWTSSFLYVFTFDLERNTGRLPSCRLGVHKTSDVGPIRAGGNFKNVGDLALNPARNNAKQWTMYDSFGQAIVIIEKLRTTRRWALWDPDRPVTARDGSHRLDANGNERFEALEAPRGGGFTRFAATAPIEPQGFGCQDAAIDSTTRARRVVAAFNAGGTVKDELGERIDNEGAMRGFIDYTAMPALTRSDGKVIPVEQFRKLKTNCRNARPGKLKGELYTLRSPRLNGSFIGTNLLHGRRAYFTYNERIAGKSGGGHLYVLANTPGVRGGGLMRAIVPLHGRSMFLRADQIGYCDTNAGTITLLRGAYGEVTDADVKPMSPRVTWSYGRVYKVIGGAPVGTNIWGWVPTTALSDARGRPPLPRRSNCEVRIGAGFMLPKARTVSPSDLAPPQWRNLSKRTARLVFADGKRRRVLYLPAGKSALLPFAARAKPRVVRYSAKLQGLKRSHRGTLEIAALPAPAAGHSR